jgi:hypothetical protein
MRRIEIDLPAVIPALHHKERYIERLIVQRSRWLAKPAEVHTSYR